MRTAEGRSGGGRGGRARSVALLGGRSAAVQGFPSAGTRSPFSVCTSTTGDTRRPAPQKAGLEERGLSRGVPDPVRKGLRPGESAVRRRRAGLHRGDVDPRGRSPIPILREKGASRRPWACRSRSRDMLLRGSVHVGSLSPRIVRRQTDFARAHSRRPTHRSCRFRAGWLCSHGAQRARPAGGGRALQLAYSRRG
jgi:hypothetical protein